MCLFCSCVSWPGNMVFVNGAPLSTLSTALLIGNTLNYRGDLYLLFYNIFLHPHKSVCTVMFISLFFFDSYREHADLRYCPH